MRIASFVRNAALLISGQGLLLNPGAYAVKIVPVGGGEGCEEQVKIEADKVTIVKAK